MSSSYKPSTLFVRDAFRAVVLITAATGSILLSVPIFTITAPPPKLFTFTERVSPSGSSLKISGVNGGVTIVPWAGSRILINGTVTVDGYGATPDQVSLEESNDNGNLGFQPIFPSPDDSVGRNYNVKVNVYVPANIILRSVNIDVLESGELRVTNLIASTVSLNTWNGDIRVGSLNASQVNVHTTGGSVQLGIGSIQRRDYYYVATTKGPINLTVPGTGNFSLSETSMFGKAYAQGFAGCQINYTQQSLGTGFGTFENRLTATCGDRSATIDLSSEDGDITVSTT